MEPKIKPNIEPNIEPNNEPSNDTNSKLNIDLFLVGVPIIEQQIWGHMNMNARSLLPVDGWILQC